MEKSTVINGMIKDLRLKKAQAKTLRNTGKMVEYQAVFEDIKKTDQSLMDMLDILDTIDRDKEKKENSCVSVLKAKLGLIKVSDTDRCIMDYMKESTGSDGGLIQIVIKYVM